MRCMPHGARAVGIANIAANGEVLDTWYPAVEYIEDTSAAEEQAKTKELFGDDAIGRPQTQRVSARDLSDNMLSLVGMDRDRQVEVVPVRTYIPDLDAPAVDAHDVYLRLHLLSHRFVRPLELNMRDALSLLTPVVWTNKGPCLPDDFELLRTKLRSRGTIHVYGIERLPRMVDYVVPSGVTIAGAERVRLGAYLAPGTSVNREGYVSYNAGTLGAARVEGRLSSACVIEGGTDIGLSAVVMATREDNLNRTPLRIGADSTFHPSSGLVGLDMGDRCSLGANIILEPDTILFDHRSDSYIAARDVTHQSDWSITLEPHSTTPVVKHR